MWTQTAIDQAVDAARSVVRPDGGELVLVEANPKRGRVILRLDVTNLRCDAADGSCLLPGRLLQGMMQKLMEPHLGGEFELRLEDPRAG